MKVHIRGTPRGSLHDRSPIWPAGDSTHSGDTMPSAKAPSAKAELRASIRRERARMTEAQRRAAAQGLCDVLLELPQLRGAERLALYVSHPDEPGTRPLGTTLTARGVEIVQPVISRARGLSWLAVPDVWGRFTPAAPGPPATGGHAEVRVMVIPALAVDTCGRRVGRGLDGYDRILWLLDPEVLVLAAVYDGELLDSAVEAVPQEPHDVRVPAVVTPTRIRYLVERVPYGGATTSVA